MTDIVERLRRTASPIYETLGPRYPENAGILNEAAALIASQARRIEELEKGAAAVIDTAVLIGKGKDEVVTREAMDALRALLNRREG